MPGTTKTSDYARLLDRALEVIFEGHPRELEMFRNRVLRRGYDLKAILFRILYESYKRGEI